MSEAKQTYGNPFSDFERTRDEAVKNAGKLATNQGSPAGTDENQAHPAGTDEKQKTKDWFMQRIGKFTGSRMPDFMRNGRGGTPWGETTKKIIYQVVAERSMTAGGLDTYVENMMKKEFLQTTWGTSYEAEAVLAIEEQTGNQVTLEGFNESPLPYFGSSVDGMIGDVALEIKCPFDPIKHEINMGMPDIVTEKHDYWWQMQSHMLVTGAKTCIFASYDSRREEPEHLKLMTCYRDAASIEQLTNKLEAAEKIVQHRLVSGVYDFDL